MKRTMNRRRQRFFPANPKRLADLDEIPDAYKVTKGGKRFLCFDSYFDDQDNDDDDEEARNKRIILFATKSSLRKLAASPILYVDGTLELAPDIFAQIVTIHGDYRHESLPFAYALMPDKKQETYTRLLEAIFKKCEDYYIQQPSPTTWVLDLEKALINAILEVAENAELRLCLFHLRQAAFRKLAELGLQAAFRDPEDDSVRKAFRQIVGIAFVPVDDVVDAFLQVRAALPARMAAFADYFETNYIMGRRPRGRRQPTAPRYPIKQWNQYVAARENLPRTNNAKEAWHNRFEVRLCPAVKRLKYRNRM